MKKAIFFLLTAVLAAFLFLPVACSDGNSAPGGAGSSATADTIEAVTEWPDNEYTRLIPRPQHGAPYQVIYNTGARRYSVWLQGITREQVKDYLRSLEEAGYVRIATGENEVSGGTMLQRDDVYLSIAYSGEGVGIGILLDGVAASG